MNRILPIRARVRGKLFGNQSFERCASKAIELAPPLRREQPSAISLPDEFDRIIAVQEETTLDIERARIASGERPHGPTVAYKIEDAVLADGSIYYKGGYDVLRSGASRLFLPRDYVCFHEAQLCTYSSIERYFGHWLRDGLLLELLACQRSMPGLTLDRQPWLHEPGYRALCGLAASRVIHARIEKLWVIDDRGINEGWIARIQELRRRLCSKLAASASKRIFLTRGNLGTSRNLTNSDEVYIALERLGFEILHPEAEDAETITEKLSSAEIAILVEGSAQVHCLLAMPVGSALVTIQPPTRFNAFSKIFADAVGIHWGYIVGERSEDGFSLPIERLARTIDHVRQVCKERSPTRMFDPH